MNETNLSPGSSNRDEYAAAQILDVDARELRKGDDLFGAGIITSAVYVGSSVRVECGGTGMTFWPDEIVTVRRA